MQETWKPVVGYEGFYEVSDEGNVRSLPRTTTKGGLLTPFVRKNGRRMVALYKEGNYRTRSVATLVLEAFEGLANGRMVLHKNDDRSSDALVRLRYGSHQDNMDEVATLGTFKGMNHPGAKLTENDVRLIRKQLAEGKHHKAIAIDFKISVESVQSIKHKRNWGWLE